MTYHYTASIALQPHSPPRHVTVTAATDEEARRRIGEYMRGLPATARVVVIWKGGAVETTAARRVRR